MCVCVCVWGGGGGGGGERGGWMYLCVIVMILLMSVHLILSIISSTPHPASDPTNLTCTNGELRLSGNSQTAPWEGNLQICFSGRWGSVCQDNWDQVDAMTACRLLGYGNGSRSIPTRRGYFGFEDVPVFLDEVNCLGNETGLLECASVAALGDHDCSNFLDAGVICAGETLTSHIAWSK